MHTGPVTSVQNQRDFSTVRDSQGVYSKYFNCPFLIVLVVLVFNFCFQKSSQKLLFGLDLSNFRRSRKLPHESDQ